MSAYSPYSNAKFLDYGDGEVLIFANTDEPVTITPITHTVMEGETPQSISHKYYGDSGYWAQIVLANKILNPLESLKPGTQLIIP